MQHKCEKLKGYVETMTLKGKTRWYYWNEGRNWANETVRCPICREWLPNVENAMSYDYSGYKWIKVKHYKMDQEKSWEERYKELEAHHIEEITFLINEVRKLAAELRHPDYAKVRHKWAIDEAELDRRFN